MTLSNYDLDIQDFIEKHEHDFKQEQTARQKTEEALNKAVCKWVKGEDLIQSLKKKNEDLEEKLHQIGHRHSEEFMRLCSEKVYQEMNYNSLLNEVNKQRTQLKEANEKLMSFGHVDSMD